MLNVAYTRLNRLDIAFTINQATQHLFALTHRDIRAVKHIFRYIKGTLYHGLTFHHDSTTHLLAYSDADWAIDVSTRRSITGGCVFPWS